MSNYKSMSRKTQARKTRERIYTVSIKLIRKYGFDRVTIEEICKKANVSIGSFYNYFASKSDVFNEIFNQIDEHFEKVVMPGLPLEGAKKQIVYFFKAYGQFTTNSGEDFVRQLYNAKSKNFINQDRFLPSWLRTIIARGQAKDEILTNEDAGEIANSLFIFARGIVFDWCLHDGSYDLTSTLEKQIGQYLPLICK